MTDTTPIVKMKAGNDTKDSFAAQDAFKRLRTDTRQLEVR